MVAAAVTLATGQRLHAQITSEFTYQGQLNNGSTPYSGSADLRFRLFSSAVALVQIGPTLTSTNVTCDVGRFTTRLDFLNEVPAGGYLEISVRTPSDPTNQAPFTTLVPRQPVTATPQAYRSEVTNFAASANLAANALSLGGQAPAYYLDLTNATGTLPAGRLAGTYTNAVGFSNAGNAFIGSGAGLTGLNANSIITGTLSPARGGTGSSIAATTVGNVLMWNGSAFTAQPQTAYLAGAGLSLTGTTFSVASGGITNTMLASDGASLNKVSGGAMQASGNNVTFAGTIAIPTTTRSLVLPAAAFVPDSNTTGVRFAAGSAFGTSGASVTLYAPISLPIGARITGFTAYGKDDDANNMSFALNNVDMVSGAVVVEATGSSGSQPFGRFALPVNGLNVLATDTHCYTMTVGWLTSTFDPSSLSFTGVRIDYTVTTPLP